MFRVNISGYAEAMGRFIAALGESLSAMRAFAADLDALDRHARARLDHQRRARRWRKS